MAYNVSYKFRENLYNGKSDYSCELYLNNNSIPVNRIESIKISSPIIDDTVETFYLGSFISQKIIVKFKNLDNLEIKTGDEFYLRIGLNVDGTYEYVPIGYFLVDNLAENYQTTCEISALDYAVKFKTPVDYSPAFGNTGKTTLINLLRWLCRYYGVELGTFPSVNNNVEIGIYDSTVSGKQYVSYIAEMFGGNAKIDREGRLNIFPLKREPSITINALKSKTWELGEKYQISKVIFDNAISNYAFGDDTENILFIRPDNIFISNESEIENIYNAVKNFSIYSLKNENYGDISLDSWDIIEFTLGDKTYQTYNNNEITYAMSVMTKINTKIPTKQQETTTNVIGGDVKTRVKMVKTNVDLINAEIELLASKTEETTKTLKTDKSVESNSETITIEDSGGYDLEKLRIDGKTYLVESLGQNGSIEIEINNGVDTQKTIIELNEPLRSLENGTKDTYENGVITRRVGITENGELYELDEPITEDIGFLSIPTFKGLNNISLNSNMPTSFGITYLTDSQLNEIYATKSQIKLTEDEINILSQKVQPVSNVIKGVGQIQLVNAYEGMLHRLSIKGNISLLFPSSQEGLYGYALAPREGLTPSATLTPSSPVPKDNKILYPSNDLFSKSSNLLIDDVEYKLDFNFLNYINDTDCDEFIYEDGKCWIIRRVGIDEYGNLYATGQEVIEPRKDIVLNVKSNSTIKLKSFENAIYKTQYLLENEYTDNFVTEVDVISRINLSHGTAVIEASKLAQITADKINLEGYTTINGGFTIDEYGNPKVEVKDDGSGENFENPSNLKVKSSEGESSLFSNGLNINNIEFGSSFLANGNRCDIIDNNDYNNPKYVRALMEDGEYGNVGFDIRDLDGSVYVKFPSGEPVLFVEQIPNLSSVTPTSVNSGSFNDNSLESIKKNITLMEECLEKIYNADITKYNYNFERDNDKKHIGLIIADKGGNYKTPSEVINQDGDAINLYSMISMSWKAIQEMYDIIKMQEVKIKKMEERLDGIIKSN